MNIEWPIEIIELILEVTFHTMTKTHGHFKKMKLGGLEWGLNQLRVSFL